MRETGTKLLFLVQRESLKHQDGRDSYVAKLSSNFLGPRNDILSCTANLIDPDMAAGLPGARIDAEDVAAAAGYTAVIECEFASDQRAPEALAAEASVIIGLADTYLIETSVAKDTAEARAVPPAVRVVSPCLGKAGMNTQEAGRRWADHVEKACRVHVGMSRYFQHRHLRALTPEAPPFFGTAMLSFQTLEDLRDRFYCDEAGAREIAEDANSFLDSFSPLMMREHRLR